MVVISLIINRSGASGKNKTGQKQDNLLLSGLVEKRRQMLNRITEEIENLLSIIPKSKHF